VCDPGKRTLRGCVGAPDMVIEILSPSTRERDLVLKQDIYLEAGVKEYWIIDPESKTVFVKLLNYNKYKTNIYNGYEIIPASVLKGLSVDMNLVYPQFP
jgi:Uma2 family endonuclease